MRKRTFFLIGILLIFGLLLSACGRSSQTTPAAVKSSISGTTQTSPAATPSNQGPAAVKPKYGGTINVASRYAINNIGGSGDFAGSDQIFFESPATEYLFKTDTNGKLIPGLAESWDSSVDGMVYTFHLKKGVKFQDGTDFNAAAVKYQFDYVVKKQTSSTAIFENVASIDVVDPYTLRFTFKTYDANCFVQISQATVGLMCSPTALQIQSQPEAIAKDHLVGTGPFRFASWQRNNNVKFEKVASYWQKGLPYLDSVQFTEFSDTTTALMALKAGQVQILDGLLPQDADGLKAAGFNIDASDYGYQRFMIPDSGNADSPFANQKVREAVDWALDKKAIAQSMGKSYATAASQLAASGDIVYDTTLMPPRNYNVQKAKDLLTAAGYPNGFKTSIIAFTTENRDLLTPIQAYLKDAGINAEIQLVDANKMAQINKEGWKNGLLVWQQGNMTPLINMQRYFIPTTYFFKSMSKSPEMVKMITDAIAQPDNDKQLVLMKSWQKYMFDNALDIPIFTGWYMQAQSPKVHNLNWGKYFANYWDWNTAWVGD